MSSPCRCIYYNGTRQICDYCKAVNKGLKKENMNEVTKTFNHNKAVEAQKKYCESGENRPHFAPGSGVCWNCRQDIYAEKGSSDWRKALVPGISVEEAGSTLITGCPFCNRSYCD
jgi:glutaredoxin